MKLLHTSDWHLGQTLISKSRKKEHEQFLDWLIKILKENNVDILLVAGDIFDSGTPPNYALQLYYNFLRRIPDTRVGAVVIIGGNHDSVSTLHAPRELLKFFNIHVLGGISDELSDEIILAKDSLKKATGIVCAVPFVRDRDIRQSIPGESYEEKYKALHQGIKTHYHEICRLALNLRAAQPDTEKNLPVIATGHLYTSGGVISESEREIHVGSLSQIDASSFPAMFDYVGLGHLHKAQIVGGFEHICYSGSPIPLSFSEVNSGKQVVIVEINSGGASPEIKKIAVPEFQKLCCIRGDLKDIRKGFELLGISEAGKEVWVEVHVDTSTWIPEIQNTVLEMAQNLSAEILAVKYYQGGRQRQFVKTGENETLEQVSPVEVFNKRLEKEKLDEKTAQELKDTFTEALRMVNQENEEEHS